MFCKLSKFNKKFYHSVNWSITFAETVKFTRNFMNDTCFPWKFLPNFSLRVVRNRVDSWNKLVSKSNNFEIKSDPTWIKTFLVILTLPIYTSKWNSTFNYDEKFLGELNYWNYELFRLKSLKFSSNEGVENSVQLAWITKMVFELLKLDYLNSGKKQIMEIT